MTENEDRNRLDPPERPAEMITCPVCDGMGRVETEDGYKPCGDCLGEGVVEA